MGIFKSRGKFKQKKKKISGGKVGASKHEHPKKYEDFHLLNSWGFQLPTHEFSTNSREIEDKIPDDLIPI